MRERDRPVTPDMPAHPDRPGTAAAHNIAVLINLFISRYFNPDAHSHALSHRRARTFFPARSDSFSFVVHGPLVSGAGRLCLIPVATAMTRRQMFLMRFR